MTEVQEKLLLMLKWFHAFCEEHGLRYFVLGGALLGAVRHKGFIPWDDDIDIGLPRTDYERFKNCMKELPQGSRYVLETPLEHKEFGISFCKLFDTSTTRIENTRFKPLRGLDIDIFPLDGIGNTYAESLKNYKKIHFKKGYQYIKTCAFRKGRKFYKNFVIFCARCLPFAWKRLAKKIDRLCAARPYEECVYIANLLGKWGKREIVERSWMGEPTLYPFEDMQVYGPCDAEKYLTAVYGDYMQLPPEEERVGGHDYLYVDLNTPYAEYRGREKS